MKNVIIGAFLALASTSAAAGGFDGNNNQHMNTLALIIACADGGNPIVVQGRTVYQNECRDGVNGIITNPKSKITQQQLAKAEAMADRMEDEYHARQSATRYADPSLPPDIKTGFERRAERAKNKTVCIAGRGCGNYTVYE